MRRTFIVPLATALVVAACHRSPEAASASRTARPVRVATAADTAFVRRICYAPDSVLAGRKPCYERVQKSQYKVF